MQHIQVAYSIVLIQDEEASLTERKVTKVEVEWTGMVIHTDYVLVQCKQMESVKTTN